eukprot:m51a1_g11602 putative mini-chromosome maintenance complex-binding protein (773) ;mRNA; r:131193-137071
MESIASDPCAAVQRLFCEAAARDSDPQALCASDWGVPALFAGAVAALAPAALPTLAAARAGAAPSGSLVRYGCMVQDIFGSDLYAGALADTPGSYEGRPPSAAPAGLPASPQAPAPAGEPSRKRPLEGDPGGGADGAVAMEDAQSGAAKRPRALGDDLARPDELLREPASSPALPAGAEANPNVAAAAAASSSSAGTPAIVYVYDQPLLERFKVNDVVEFVGVYEADPELAYAIGRREGVETDFAEEDSGSPKGPQHAVTYREEGLGCGHPVLASPVWYAGAEETRAASASARAREAMALLAARVSEGARIARQNLVAYIATALGGDTLAAEFVLLSLISRVCVAFLAGTCRTEVAPIGKLSVGLGKCPEGSSAVADALASVVSRVSCRSCSLSLSIDELNRRPLAPYKDYERNVLVACPLQVAAGTVVVVDETPISAGTLHETGVKNVQALRKLIAAQSVDYDFRYHPIEFAADCPCLVLSVGQSILKATDCYIPLQPSYAFAAPSVPAPLQEERLLEESRAYVAVCRHMEFEADPAVMKRVQERFVRCRQEGDAEVTAETLHYWLNLTRLVCASFGQAKLTDELYQYAMDLEGSGVLAYAATRASLLYLEGLLDMHLQNNVRTLAAKYERYLKGISDFDEIACSIRSRTKLIQSTNLINHVVPPNEPLQIQRHNAAVCLFYRFHESQMLEKTSGGLQALLSQDCFAASLLAISVEIVVYTNKIIESINHTSEELPDDLQSHFKNLEDRGSLAFAHAENSISVHLVWSVSG